MGFGFPPGGLEVFPPSDPGDGGYEVRSTLHRRDRKCQVTGWTLERRLGKFDLQKVFFSKEACGLTSAVCDLKGSQSGTGLGYGVGRFVLVGFLPMRTQRGLT